MSTINQYTQSGDLVHAHAYTPTAGDLNDVCFIGDRWSVQGVQDDDKGEGGRYFAVALSDGSIDIIRITGQTENVDNSPGPSSVADLYSIDYKGSGRFIIGYRTGVLGNIKIGPIARINASGYRFTTPQFGTSPFILAGGCVNGRDVYIAYNRLAIPRVHRIVWLRGSDVPGSIKIVKQNMDSSPSWGSSNNDAMRGLAFNGRDFFVLFRRGAVMHLESHRNENLHGSKNLRRLSRKDITSDVGVTDGYGLTFDGRYLYVGER